MSNPNFLPYDQWPSSHRRVQHENQFPRAEREMLAAAEVLKKARDVDSAIGGLKQKQMYCFNNFRAELVAEQRIPDVDKETEAVALRRGASAKAKN